MSTVKEPEVIDLDFTYEDGYVHIIDIATQTRLCGGPRRKVTEHKHHSPPLFPADPTPTHCGCGTPHCPVCVHVREMSRRGITS